MTEFDTPEAARALIKEALEAVLHDNRDWLRDLVQEALVETAQAEARREADLRLDAQAPRPFRLPRGRA